MQNANSDRPGRDDHEGSAGGQPGTAWLSQSVLRHVTQDAQVRDALLAHACHALRTPLNAIQGWSYVLEHQLPGTTDATAGAVGGDAGNPLVRRALHGIRTGIAQQAMLLDHLMDAAQLLSGHLQLSTQSLSLQPLITSAVEQVGEDARARDIDLELCCALHEQDDAWVEGDARRLESVLAHLLDNALRYTPRQGHVRVDAWREENRLLVRITDDGMGIPADRLPHLFDGALEPSPRAGLGLFLASRLAALHGGTLTADSAGPGLGSSFTLCLPARESGGAVH